MTTPTPDLDPILSILSQPEINGLREHVHRRLTAAAIRANYGFEIALALPQLPTCRLISRVVRTGEPFAVELARYVYASDEWVTHPVHRAPLAFLVTIAAGLDSIVEAIDEYGADLTECARLARRSLEPRNPANAGSHAKPDHVNAAHAPDVPGDPRPRPKTPRNPRPDPRPAPGNPAPTPGTPPGPP